MVGYEEVHCLFLSWEDGDEEMYKQLLELKDVFECFYNYQTYEWKIPSLKAHSTLNQRLLDFMQYDKLGTLLIVYYAGYGGLDKDRDAVWMW